MSDEYTTISHDAFGRWSRIRRTVPRNQRKSCDWCGAQPGRFQYGTLDDAKSEPSWGGAKFCSIGCFKAYNAE